MQGLVGRPLEPDELPPPPQYPVLALWPEHLTAWSIWLAAQTCMRRGLDGATGLDYAQLDDMLRLTRCVRLPPRRHRRRQVWADVRILECAALREWAAMRREHAAAA